MDLDEEELKATRILNGVASADEMFGKLGYKKDFSWADEIIEYYKYDGELEDDLYIIRFYLNKKRVWKNSSITMQELQVINQKCKELGWIWVKKC